MRASRTVPGSGGNDEHNNEHDGRNSRGAEHGAEGIVGKADQGGVVEIRSATMSTTTRMTTERNDEHKGRNSGAQRTMLREWWGGLTKGEWQK